MSTLIFQCQKKLYFMHLLIIQNLMNQLFTCIYFKSNIFTFKPAEDIFAFLRIVNIILESIENILHWKAFSYANEMGFFLILFIILNNWYSLKIYAQMIILILVLLNE